MSRLKHSIYGLFYDYHNKTHLSFRISERKPKVRRPEAEGTATGTRVESVQRRPSIRVLASELDNPNYTRDLKRIHVNVETLEFSYACRLYDQKTINCTLLFYWLNHKDEVMILLPGSPGPALPKRYMHISISSKTHGKERSFVNQYAERILSYYGLDTRNLDIRLIWR